jgi:hypothetical protein
MAVPAVTAVHGARCRTRPAVGPGGLRHEVGLEASRLLVSGGSRSPPPWRVVCRRRVARRRRAWPGAGRPTATAAPATGDRRPATGDRRRYGETPTRHTAIRRDGETTRQGDDAMTRRLDTGQQDSGASRHVLRRPPCDGGAADDGTRRRGVDSGWAWAWGRHGLGASMGLGPAWAWGQHGRGGGHASLSAGRGHGVSSSAGQPMSGGMAGTSTSRSHEARVPG